MGLELGRISGPLLSANLLRNGTNLAFEDDLVYLDVNGLQVGIKTASPSEQLEIDGLTRTVNLKVDNKADIADLTFQLNKIQNRLGGAIYIAANGLNGTVSTERIEVGAAGVTNLRFDNTDITNTVTNSDIEIKAYSLADYVNFNTNRVEVNGNLHATGSITANGNIIFGSSDTDTVDFNADIASDIIPNTTGDYTLGNIDKPWQQLNSELVNGQLVETSTLIPSGVDMLLTQGSVYYVSINGNDTYLGTHLHNTFRTLKHALSVAVTGDEIIIFAGTYTEEFPLTIPQGVSVRGMGIRSVTIEPTVGTNDKDCFLMNGESTVSFLTIKNFYYNATNNTGYAFRFANGMKTTTRSPYVQYITTITQGSVTSLSDPRGFDQGDAGRGALADGAVCDPLCKDAALLFHAVTFICPNADGITATNGVRIEWLNSFTYFANQGIYLLQGALGFAGLGVKFGAEFRSIGSANVYGNYGAVADGADTLGYLIGHNFGYIGTGKDSNNDYGLVVQEHEIVEINDGVLYYDSMDHKGDYRVGDIFYVNQETGAIRFNAQAIDFTAGGSIVFEGEGAGVTINATEVLINYIRIYDNNIDSTVGPVNFYAASGTTTLNTQVFITGNLDVTGELRVKGNVFLGDNPLDTVNVVPRLTQTIEPDINNTYTLGTNAKRWRTAFLTLVNIDDIIQLADNELTTLTTDTDLRLVAAGTGKVNVTTTDVDIANNLTVATLNVNGDTTLQDVVIATPTLTTTQVAQNVSGTSSPTGFFFYGWQGSPSFSLIQPGWTVVGQPTWVVTTVGDGVTNYDVTITGGSFASGQSYAFTGYVDGPATINLVGDIDLIGDITQTGNVQIINITGHDYLQATNIKIDGNIIQVTDTDTDINFTANGTGGVKIDQRLKFTNSTISNVWASPTTNTQRSILFTPNGTGNVVIDKTNALTIPYGNNTNRTLTAPGEIRQNSTNNFYEGLTSGGMVSFIGLYDTNKGSYITAELTPGTNDNILRFGINGDVKSTINTTTMSIDNVFVDEIRLNGNTVSNRITNNDLVFSPNGTGTVDLNDIPFGNNQIINATNGALTLQSTGTGYIKFGGTYGVVIPTGVNDDRNVAPELGEVRHNSQIGYMEVFNGTIWIPAVGTLGAAPLSEVLDIMDLWSLVLG